MRDLLARTVGVAGLSPTADLWLGTLWAESLRLVWLAASQDAGSRSIPPITAEVTRQDDAGIVADLEGPRQQDARIHAYAAGRLGAVGQGVAAAFRTTDDNHTRGKAQTMTVAPHCHFKVDVTGTILDTPIANAAYFDTFDTYAEAVHTLVTALRDGLRENHGAVDRVNITHGHDPDRWVSALHEVVMVPQWHHLTGDTMPMQVEYHAYRCRNPDCLVR